MFGDFGKQDIILIWNKTMVDMIDQKHNEKTASFQFKTIPM